MNRTYLGWIFCLVNKPKDVLTFKNITNFFVLRRLLCDFSFSEQLYVEYFLFYVVLISKLEFESIFKIFDCFFYI